MMAVVDRPLIQYAVDEAVAAGITDMIFITGRNKRAIEDHFDKAYELEAELAMRGKEDLLRLVREVLRFAFGGHGVLTYTAGIGHGFIRSRPDLETPDCQLFFAHGSFDAYTRKFDAEPGMTIGVYQCRPESRGSIHIGSPDLRDAPKIRPNFLSDPVDRAALIGGMRITRQVGEAAAFAKYRDHETKPGPDCKTDDELLDYARGTGATTYHVMGTCSMGPASNPQAVVDERLRVRGLTGLRVIDASVMPTMPSGNINAAVLMVAEKAADMILEDARAMG